MKIPAFEIRYQLHAYKRTALNALVTCCNKRASFARPTLWVEPSQIKCPKCQEELSRGQ
jgi:hypothetical protein